MKKIILNFLFIICLSVISTSLLITSLTKNNKNKVISLSTNKNNQTETQTIDTEINQLLAYHGNGWNTNVDEIKIKPIEFHQDIKTIFTSSNNEPINGGYFVKSLEQITKPTQIENTGSYRWGDAKFDTNDRIQDWKDVYKDFLRINPKKIEKEWGVFETDLYLENANVWPKNSDFHSIAGNVVFSNGADQSYTYKNAKDFDLHIGVNRNFENKSYLYYGVPFTKLKEVQYVYVFNNYVRRYLWGIQGINANELQNLSFVKTIGKQLKINLYKIQDLICLSNPDYINGTIQIKFNYDFINLAKSINEAYEKLIEIDWNDFSDQLKDIFINCVNNFKIQSDNFDTIFLKLNKSLSTSELLNFIDNNLSLNYDLAKKHKLIKNQNPFLTIQPLIDLIDISLDYQIPNINNPNIFDNIQMIVKNDDLKKGKIIHLNKNSLDQYEIKINCLASQEINTVDDYVQTDKTTSLINECEQILSVDNSDYILRSPIIKKVEFNGLDNKNNTNFYANDLTDNELLKKFVIAYDDYGNKNDGSILSNSYCNFLRDEINGKIEIKIKIGKNIYDAEINNFKKPNFETRVYDANKLESLIYIDEINDEKINKILLKNDFDKNILSLITLSVDKIDKINGEIFLRIINSKDDYLFNKLKNYDFKIKNLAKYYLKQKDNINIGILNLKPSEITKSVFIKEFLEISSEFLILNDLKINLKPNDGDKKLNVNIKYNDYFSKENFDFNYSYYFKNKFLKSSTYSFIFIIVIGFFILLVGLFFNKKPKIK